MPKREDEYWAGMKEPKGRGLCPRCGSSNISYNKRFQSWRCNKCEHSFPIPSYGPGGDFGKEARWFGKTTEKIFKNMPKLETLFFEFSINFTVTKNIFIYLKNVYVLCLNGVSTLQDEDLKYIGQNVSRLYIDDCLDITDKGLSYINQDLYISLQNNLNITLNGVRKNKHLYSETIYVSFILDTNRILVSLKHETYYVSCYNIYLD